MTSLKNHMRLKCNGKQHECDVCDKLFNNYSVLVVHKRVHFGVRPYKCVDCGDGFSCTSSLKSHYKWHKEQNLSDYAIDEPNINLTSYQSIGVKVEQVSDYLSRFQPAYLGKCLYNCLNVILML